MLAACFIDLFTTFVAETLRGRAEEARLAHNQEDGGSNPSPATKCSETPQHKNKKYYRYNAYTKPARMQSGVRILAGIFIRRRELVDTATRSAGQPMRGIGTIGQIPGRYAFE